MRILNNLSKWWFLTKFSFTVAWLQQGQACFLFIHSNIHFEQNYCKSKRGRDEMQGRGYIVPTRGHVAISDCIETNGATKLLKHRFDLQQQHCKYCYSMICMVYIQEWITEYRGHHLDQPTFFLVCYNGTADCYWYREAVLSVGGVRSGAQCCCLKCIQRKQSSEGLIPRTIAFRTALSWIQLQ